MFTPLKLTPTLPKQAGTWLDSHILNMRKFEEDTEHGIIYALITK